MSLDNNDDDKIWFWLMTKNFIDFFISFENQVNKKMSKNNPQKKEENLIIQIFSCLS